MNSFNRPSVIRGIRVGVRAAIVRDGQILLVEGRDDFGPYRFAAELGLDEGTHFNLPGGGVDLGESLHRALLREFLEETGSEIEIGRLLIVYEYVPTCYSAAEQARYGQTHKVEFIFEGRIKFEGGLLRRPDDCQIGLRWFPLEGLARAPLLPCLGEQIVAALLHPNAPDPFCRDYHECM